MGNSELPILEDASMETVETVERMVLKFPRALFEEVVAKMEERRTSPNKTKAKRKHLFSRSKKHNPYPLSPSSPSSPSSPASPLSFSSLSSLSFDSPSSSSPSSSTSSSPVSFSSSPSSSSSSDTQEPENVPIVAMLPIPISSELLPNIEQENRPVRESKKKFYELLSSVVAGDPCPSRFENTHVNQLNTSKPSLLSKQQKRGIAQLMMRRRHFPAEIITIEGKGTGVRTLRALKQFQFICEYNGDLITKTEALRREKLYAATSTTRIMSCYMYYFEHRGQEYCLDATTEDGAWGIGRLINHSVNGNLDTVKIVVDNVPRLAFVANRDIKAGEELAYDYGDRTSFAAFPWLKK